MKRKYLCANEASFMTKELNKAIMKRSRLRKNEINRNNYQVQRNHCKKLLKTTKKQHFNNLNTSKVTDNRTFWKIVVPLFTNSHLEVKRSFSRKVIQILQIILNYVKCLTLIFQRLWLA